MNYNKQLAKDIADTWPFPGVKIPRAMKCYGAQASNVFVDYIDGVGSGDEGSFWESVSFEGDFVGVTFKCRSNGISNKISIEDLDIFGNPQTDLDIDFLIDEMKFVRDVLAQSD